MYSLIQNCVMEVSFTSGKSYDDPFNEVELDVIFEGPNGSKQVVPAFWAGENLWKMRFSTPATGRYSYTTVCSDKDNTSLNNQKGEIEVSPYQGTNPLFKHGPLRVSNNRRYLEHIDGTPFFWLSDIWIYATTKRVVWPQDFRMLTEDRVRKGFSVIALTAGLVPRRPVLLSEYDANEGGLPYDENFTRINPAYFDMADLRIEHLVDSGLMPMLYGCWGYHLPVMGVTKVKKHWRYVIARYGAYPMIWNLVAEPLLPFEREIEASISEEIQKWKRERRREWTEIARYVRQMDPYHRLLTIHSDGMQQARKQLDDPSLLDFDYVQICHGDWFIVGPYVEMILEAVKSKPKMPVIPAEACYEGHLGTGFEDLQRFFFWSGVLSGACGRGYGAEGVFSSHLGGEQYPGIGGTYSPKSWKEGYQLAGSKQLGISKKLLERYPWWQLEPHPEWVKRCWYFTAGDTHSWKRDKHYTCYAAGIPRELRIIYFPIQRFPRPVIGDIESDVTYRAFFFDPTTAREFPLGKVEPNEKGEWAPPSPFMAQDGILVLEREKSSR